MISNDNYNDINSNGIDNDALVINIVKIRIDWNDANNPNGENANGDNNNMDTGNGYGIGDIDDNNDFGIKCGINDNINDNVVLIIIYQIWRWW